MVAIQEQKTRLYVSDFAEQILSQIKEGSPLSVHAPTGSGKTRGTLAKLEDYEGIAYQLLKKYPNTKVRFAAPTRILAEQSGKGYNLPFLMGGLSKEDRQKAIDADITVSTFNLLPLSITDIKNTHLIIDEWHFLVEMIGYNGKEAKQVAKKVWDLIREAKTVTLLSATPPPFFERLNVNYQSFGLQQLNRVEIETRLYEGSQKHQIIPTLLDHAKNGAKGSIWVYMNDKKSAKAFKKRLLKSMPKDRRVIELNQNSKGSEDYDYLVENKRVKDDVSIVIVTKLLSAGIEVFNQDVKGVYYFDPSNKSGYPNPNDFKQFVARFRDLEKLNVVHFCKLRTGSKSFDPNQLFAAEYTKAKAEVQRIVAQKEIANLLETDNAYHALSQVESEAKSHRLNSISNKPEIDTLEICSKVFRTYLNSLSTGEYFDQIRRGNDNFVFVDAAEFVPTFKDGELEQIETEQKEAEQLADMRLSDLITREPVAVYQAIYNTDNIEQEVKQAIRKHIGRQAFSITPMAELVQENHKEDIKHTTFLPVFASIQLEKAGFTRTEIANIFKHLSKEEKESRTERLTNLIENASTDLETGNVWEEKLTKAKNQKASLLEKVENWETRKRKAIEKQDKKISYWSSKESEKAEQHKAKATAEKARITAYYDDLIESGINTQDKKDNRLERLYEAREKELTGIPERKEKAERQLQFIKTHSDKVYFSLNTFRVFTSTLETLKLCKLGHKSTRHLLGNEESYKAGIYNSMVRYFRNFKAETKYTREQIEKIYLKIRHPEMTTSQIEREYKQIQKGRDGGGMQRFKELFEYETIRTGEDFYYVAKSRKTLEIFCQRGQISAQDFIKRNRSILARNADSKPSIQHVKGKPCRIYNNNIYTHGREATCAIVDQETKQTNNQSEKSLGSIEPDTVNPNTGTKYFYPTSETKAPF